MNNKGADQTARMHRLVCACVVRKQPKTGFLVTRPILSDYDGFDQLYTGLSGLDPNPDIFCPENVVCCVYLIALQTKFILEANTMNLDQAAPKGSFPI